MLDLQPIDDLNLGCPRFGGPVVELPPDRLVGAMFESLQMPTAWHQFPWIKEIWKVATGKGVRVAVLDTGTRNTILVPSQLRLDPSFLGNLGEMAMVTARIVSAPSCVVAMTTETLSGWLPMRS